MLRLLPLRLLPLFAVTPAIAVPPPQVQPSALYTQDGYVNITLPDGTKAQAKRGQFTRPFCVDGHDVHIHDLKAMIERREATGPQKSTVSRTSRGGGMNLIWNVFGTTSPEAEAGLQTTSDFFAQYVQDDVTIEINVTFDPGSFGGTGPFIIFLDYETVRQALLADADGDDSILDLLPPDSFPARRTFGGSISDETEMVLTFANARALGIEFDDEGEVDAEMFIGDYLDFDPTDGIGAPAPSDFSGVDILIHEVGHAIGFINVIEFGFFETTPLDLFRFQQTGADDPETDSEFTTFPRALYVGSFSGDQQHQFDIIKAETPMSNASDFQASHFRETNFGDPFAERLGIMEPAVTSFETRFPTYVSQADTDAFDVIGWDISSTCSPADLAEPFGELNFDDVIAFLGAFGAMEDAADLAEPEGVWNFDDVLSFLTLFGAGCP